MRVQYDIFMMGFIFILLQLTLLVSCSYNIPSMSTTSNPFSPRIYSQSYTIRQNISFSAQSIQQQSGSIYTTFSSPSSDPEVELQTSTLSVQSSFPSTFCSTCEHLYLLQLKPHYNMTKSSLHEYLDTKLHPYSLFHQMSDELFIISGPINPSLDIILALLPNNSVFKTKYTTSASTFDAPHSSPNAQFSPSSRQNTTDIPYFSLVDENLGLIDLLSLSQLDLLELLQIVPSQTPPLSAQTSKFGSPSPSPSKLSFDHIDTEYIPVIVKFVSFLQQINNDIPGVVGLSHYDPSMKLSLDTLHNLQQFYIPHINTNDIISNNNQLHEKKSPIAQDDDSMEASSYYTHLFTFLTPTDQNSTSGNNTTHDDLIFDLEQCLYEYYFPNNATLSSLRATLGSFQIETDEFLDHIHTSSSLHDKDHDNDNINDQTPPKDKASTFTPLNPLLQPFSSFQRTSTSNNIFNYFLRNISYQTVDKDGIFVNILPYQPCLDLMSKYTNLKALVTKIEDTMNNIDVNLIENDINQKDQTDATNYQVDLVAGSAIEYEHKDLVLHVNTMSATHMIEVMTHFAENRQCLNLFDDIQVSPHHVSQFNLYITSQQTPTKDSLLLLQQFYQYQANFQKKTSTQTQTEEKTSPLDISTILHRYFNNFITKQDQFNNCIQFLAQHPYVLTLSVKPTVTTLNHKTKLVLQDRNFSTTKMWTRELTGKNQTVIVGDTGVDPDHCFFHDRTRPISQYNSHIGSTRGDNPSKPDYLQRKIIWYVTNWGDDRDDAQGHGTHVAGTVAGSVLLEDTDSNTFNKLSPYNGHGLDTRLIVLDFKNTGKNQLNVPEDLYHEIFVPFSSRIESASISSHSWGGDSGYTTYSLSTDSFCFNNPYHLVVFAAGNNGKSSFRTILSPGDAKNVLTVGASLQLSDGQGIQITMHSSTVVDKMNPIDIFSTKVYAYAIASFGSSLSVPTPLNVVLAENIEACEPLTRTAHNTIYTNAIVIVRRGSCSFVTKSNSVFASGAAAMILVNNISTPPTSMGVDTTAPVYNRSYSAAMIAQNTGEALIDIMLRYRNLMSQGLKFTMIGPVVYSGPDSYSHAMADFSSRGPTRDGRIKPDIVAPGQSIYSARSDGRVGGVNCLAPEAGGIYANSGTSMATPAVSGALSLARQYFESGHYAKYYQTLIEPISGNFNVHLDIMAENHPNKHNNTFAVLENNPITAQAVVKTDLAYLKHQFRITSAAMKSVAIASAQPATGQVLVAHASVSAHYQNVTISPMSPFQGWGILNLDRILMFSDESFTHLDSQKPITSIMQAPPSRLYIFDSLSEDVVNIRSILSNDEPFIEEVHDDIKARINTARETFKFDEKGQDFFRIDKLPGLIDAIVSPTQQELSTKGETMVTSPYSFMLDANTINFQRCAPMSAGTTGTPSIPIDATKELYSCGLSVNSIHSHCVTIQTEDILHGIEFTIDSGVQPGHKYIQESITITNASEGVPSTMPLIDIVFHDFASPASPVYNDPYISRASLVWTDPPGSLQDDKVLVNNLDLFMKTTAHNHIVINATHVALLRLSDSDVQSTQASKEAINHINQQYALMGSDFQALDEAKYYLSSFIPIDWDKYRTLYPHAFQLTDSVHIKHGINLSGTSTGDIQMFAAPLLHLSTKNYVFNTGNSHSPMEHPKQMSNEKKQLFVDVVNNIEVVGLTFSSVHLNAYVLSAAIHLGQHLDVTYSVRSAQLSTVYQHYALTITGALPSGITLPTPTSTLDTLSYPSLLNTIASNTEMLSHDITLTTTMTPQQHTFGICSAHTLQDLCPNNCNVHLTANNKCVAGRCICGYAIIPATETTTNYNATLVVQYSGADCSIQSDVLSHLCAINEQGKSTNSACVINRLDETISTPIIAPTIDVIEPWEWKYYTIPAAIVQQALKLTVTNGKKYEIMPSDMNFMQDEDKKGDDGEGEEEEEKEVNPITPTIVVPDTVYIGIKFTVFPSNPAQAQFKGDPDLYISDNGYPTLSNFQYANRICDSCYTATSKTNIDPTPRQPVPTTLNVVDMITMFFTEDQQDSHTDMNLQELDQELDLESLHISMVQNNANKYRDILTQLQSQISPSPSTLNDFSPLTMQPQIAPNVPTNFTLPPALRNDKDVLWIDGSYFDSSPLKTVTLGVYGHCCYKAQFKLSIFGVHTNAYPLVPDTGFTPIPPDITPPTPTPTPTPTPVPVEPEPTDPEPTQPTSPHDSLIFTLFFVICACVFVTLCVVLCCKKYFTNLLHTSPFCAPIRTCCNFNKIPTEQETKTDAQQRHGILYRLFGCYYFTTYCCFCFGSNTLSYQSQNDDDTNSNEQTAIDLPSSSSYASSYPPSTENKDRTRSTNNTKKSKKDHDHHDGTNVTDLGPISDNPFTTTTSSPPLPSPIKKIPTLATQVTQNQNPPSARNDINVTRNQNPPSARNDINNDIDLPQPSQNVQTILENFSTFDDIDTNDGSIDHFMIEHDVTMTPSKNSPSNHHFDDGNNDDDILGGAVTNWHLPEDDIHISSPSATTATIATTETTAIAVITATALTSQQHRSGRRTNNNNNNSSNFSSQ